MQVFKLKSVDLSQADFQKDSRFNSSVVVFCIGARLQ